MSEHRGFLSWLGLSTHTPEAPRQTNEALVAGAGRMSPPEGDGQWRQETLQSLSFCAQVAKSNGSFVVTISVRQPNARKSLFLGQCSFTIQSTEPAHAIILKRYKTRYETFDIGIKNLQNDFGITVDAERFFKAGYEVEWRFRLKQIKTDGTDETFIGTISSEAHWQASHSHRSYSEVLWLMRGVLVLVARDAQHPSWVRVRALSITGDPIPGKGTPAREVIFTYDTESGTIVEATQAIDTIGEKVFFQTELDHAHNIFLSSDAIVGTSKKFKKVIPKDASDWKAETDFDETLNSARNNSMSVHANLLDVVYAAIQNGSTR